MGLSEMERSTRHLDTENRDTKMKQSSDAWSEIKTNYPHMSLVHGVLEKFFDPPKQREKIIIKMKI